jgi:hypothetical protein
LEKEQIEKTYMPLGIRLDVFTRFHSSSMVTMGEDIVGKDEKRKTGFLHRSGRSVQKC